MDYIYDQYRIMELYRKKNYFNGIGFPLNVNEFKDC